MLLVLMSTMDEGDAAVAGEQAHWSFLKEVICCTTLPRHVSC